MHILAIDTLQYSKRLQEAGFTQAQAEIQVRFFKEQTDAISDLIDDTSATKTDARLIQKDIENVRSETKKDVEIVHKEIEVVHKEIENVRMEIESLRSETKKDIENLRSETKKDIENVRMEIKQMGYRVIISLGGIITAGVAILGFLIKL